MAKSEIAEALPRPPDERCREALAAYQKVSAMIAEEASTLQSLQNRITQLREQQVRYAGEAKDALREMRGPGNHQVQFKEHIYLISTLGDGMIVEQDPIKL